MTIAEAIAGLIFMAGMVGIPTLAIIAIGWAVGRWG